MSGRKSKIMKNILIITSSNLPIPPVKGGAVQNLIYFYLLNNEINHKFNFTVTSIYNEKAVIETEKRKFKNTKFVYISNSNSLEKIQHSGIKGVSGLIYKYRKKHHIKEIEKIFGNINDKFDMILYENVPEYTCSFSNFNGKKILHLHNDSVNIDTFDSYDNFEKNVDGIIAVSEYISRRVKQVYKKPVYTVYNAISLKKPNSERIKHIKQIYDIKDSDLVFIFTGRIVEEKGIHIFLQALANFEPSNIKVLLVGGKGYGDDIKDEYYYKLKSIVSNLSDQVIFTGYVDYSNMIDYLMCADVGFLLSIIPEALPMTAIEYISMGIPVIGTKMGGITEVIDETCGFLIDNDEHAVENCEEIIKKIINNKNELSLKKVAAQKKSKLFSMDSYNENMLKIMSDFT